MTARPSTSRTISSWLASAEGQTWWARDDREPHRAASTMKLPVAVAAYRLHERGVLDLDAPVRVRDELDSAVAGRRFTVHRDYDQDPETWDLLGQEVPLRDLVRRSISVSGNLAADLVLDAVGPDEVAAVLEEAGASPLTTVAHGIEDTPAIQAGLRNVVTARDLGLVLVGIVDGRLGGPEAMGGVEADLRAQTDRAGIPAGFPDGVVVAHKTGWIGGVTHDAALVRPSDHPPFVLVVLTRHGASPDDGSALVARVAAQAWAALEQRAGRPLQS